MRVGIYQDHHNEMLKHWCVDNVVDAINLTKSNSAFALSNTKHPDIKNADVIIFYRTGYHAKLFMNQLRKDGKKVGYFIDDYLWGNTPQAGGMPLTPFFDCIDFFMFPNHELEKKAKEVSSLPIVVIDPGLDEKTYEIMASRPPLNPDNGKFNILITKGHATDDFVKYTVSILNELKNIPKKIHVIYFMGKDLPFKSTESISFERINPVKFSQFYQKLASLQIDMILNATPEDDFHDCKSPLKFLEASSLKVPLLTSRIAAFKKMKDFEHILFGSTPDEYVSKIMWAINFPEKLKQISENSRKLLHSDFMLKNNIDKFMDDLGALLFSPKKVFISEKAADKEEKQRTDRARLEKERSLSPVHFNSAPVPKKEMSQIVERKRERLSDEKMPELSEKTDGVCMPITFKSFIEFEFQCFERKISGIEVFGATYNSAIKNPARFDVFCGNRLISSGMLDPSEMLDNRWWPLDFREFHLDNSMFKFRIYNMDRRPISFYLAANNTLGQKCSVNGNHTEPIAVKIF